MKKFFLFSLAFVIGALLNAQGISYGFKAGLNLSNYNSSISGFDDVVKTRTSFHVGAVVEFGLSDQFAVQPELLYSSVGAKIDYSEDVKDTAGDMFYVMDYLSIPVMVKYYPTKNISLELGPQLGILLSAKMKMDGESEDFKDESESIDFGAGIGAEYKLDKGLFFNVRYVLGLTNVIKEVSGDDYIKNNVFQFSVGYKFM